MNKLGIWAIAIAGAFVIGILSANPVVEAVGGWQAAIAGHETRISALEAGGSTTHMIVIGPEEFAITESVSETPVKPGNQMWLGSSGFGRAFAPVDLPDGATVTEFACSFIKLDSQNYGCELRSSPFGSTGGTLMALVNTNSLPVSGTPGIVSTNSITDPLIDRDTTSYFVEFEQLVNNCASQCRLESVKITYTVP